MSPRVLHVDTAVEWRGGQQQLAYLLEGRPGDRWAGVPGSPLSERCRPPEVALFPNNDPRNLLRLRAAEADLIAAHTPHAHGLALFAGRPLVVHRRVDFATRHPWKYRRASRVVAVSEGVRRVLIAGGIAAERVTVVYDGVPEKSPETPTLELPRPLYGAVGALVAHKGHRFLVEAMREVPGTLVIVGEGPLRGELERQIAGLGLQGRVLLLGRRTDLGGIFASLDVFVHPSVEEGFGQVIVEALGAGCRVVGTRAGGVPEGVGEAGILVVPGDSSALAVVMKAALERPKGEGIGRAKLFSVERMVEETGRVYAAVWGEAGGEG